MESRRSQRAFLGFRPKEVFDFGEEFLARLRDSYAKVNIADKFAAVILLEKVLAHVVNNRAFFVLERVHKARLLFWFRYRMFPLPVSVQTADEFERVRMS